MSHKIISVNTQGYFGDDVNFLANRHKPIVLVVNEHKQSDLSNLDVIDGYNLATGYAAITSQRGVGVFVRDDVAYHIRRDLASYAREGEFETASVELPSFNLVVTGLYRSPSSRLCDFNESLADFARKIRRELHKSHVIAGDFNTDSRGNTGTNRVLDKYGLEFNLFSPTHEMGRCLDNFVTNFRPRKTRVMKAQRDQISDHSPIELTL